MAEIDLSLKVKNYRCFSEEFVGFEIIKPVNIVIGRNNSGKSALLDLVQTATTDNLSFARPDRTAGRIPTLSFSTLISDQAARGVFRENVSGGGILGRDSHWNVGQRYVGRRGTWIQPANSGRDDRQGQPIPMDGGQLYQNEQAQAQFETHLVRAMQNPLQGRLFRRLMAERDVRPEQDDVNSTEPQPNGSNVTNLIQRFYNQDGLDRSVIEVKLLDELNLIVRPDYEFEEIVLRRSESNLWEIHLREATKGLVPLSASGSGLKTILCVLASMSLWPIFHNAPALNHYIFAFEELENSLHPALLRRLLSHVAKRIVAEQSHLFLTTHSSIAIDMFAGDPDAQIIHTTHVPGGQTRVRSVSEYLHQRDVLDDLDVRPSDLLQANGIVWVEGPSDRTYLNHWIALESDGQLREGVHYQCVFYGGRLLAHLSAAAPEENDEGLLSILRVNRNAAVVIDSDRAREDAEINATKRRIADEIREIGGVVWITAGREIENYLPQAALAAASGVALPEPIGAFADLEVQLEQRSPGSGKQFRRSKAKFAVTAAAESTRANQVPMLDWQVRMRELCAEIKRWNRLPENAA